nr:putative retrotransposon Ty1-copia subclass protein [Tanacetum cinerariifolium]
MVWVLVDLPPGCKTVESNWIFKKKTDMDGIVHTYEARLVVKGYTQLYKVNYEETFSPVIDIRAIRILISIAALYDYEIWQMDVKTAFLNGYLDEDIYIVQPEGFVDSNHLRKELRLQDIPCVSPNEANAQLALMLNNELIDVTRIWLLMAAIRDIVEGLISSHNEGLSHGNVCPCNVVVLQTRALLHGLTIGGSQEDDIKCLGALLFHLFTRGFYFGQGSYIPTLELCNKHLLKTEPEANDKHISPLTKSLALGSVLNKCLIQSSRVGMYEPGLKHEPRVNKWNKRATKHLISSSRLLPVAGSGRGMYMINLLESRLKQTMLVIPRPLACT